MSSSGVGVHAAFLRVYEPLAAFDGPARRRWEAYVADGAAVTPAEGVVRERAAALRAVALRPPRVVPAVEEHAFVTEVDGVTLVCPWRTRLRALEAVEEFTAELPDEVVRAFLPLEGVRAAAQELEQERLARPGERTAQLSSAWHVPLRWFVLVDAEERQVRLAPPDGDGSRTGSGTGGTSVDRLAGRGLVYRTAMSRARRRTAKALAVLRRTVEDGEVAAGLEDLGRWLEEFHPRSLVELDYGGLVHLLDDTALAEDESAADVAAALAALSSGDATAATEAYARVTARMKALQAVESAN
jgi:hypothetical protein